MLSRRAHRLTTWSLLAAYLVANLVGGLFHDHEHAHDCQQSVACAGAEHACDHEHESEHADHHHDADDDAESLALSGTPALDHDHDCAVCRYLGQRILSVAVVIATTHVPAIAMVALVPADEPHVTLARTTRSRAPPALG